MESDKALSTIDNVAKIFSQAAKITLEKATRQPIRFSKTFQEIPKVSMKPEIGCFVQFAGDYNGLMIFNFSGDAAMTLYRNYMLTMGLAAQDLATEYTSNDVTDTIGEICNQIMGKAVRMIESKYDLSSFFGQPKALALNSAIVLTPNVDYQNNRRVAFNIDASRFHMEIAMEKTDFISAEAAA